MTFAWSPSMKATRTRLRLGSGAAGSAAAGAAFAPLPKRAIEAAIVDPRK